METIHYRCYKIASKIPLEKLESFFKVYRPLRWKEYMILDENQLSIIFANRSTSKSVYLFQYGCVSFINFTEDEVLTFLQYIAPITGSIDFNLFSKYHENHMIQLDENRKGKLWQNSEESFTFMDFYSHIICIILAKSLELYKLETDITCLLDYAENYLNHLSHGKFRRNKKGFASIVSNLIRIEYHIMNDIKIFERDTLNDESLVSRIVYDRLSQYYELEERSSVIQNKIEDLRVIYESYSSLSYRQNEKGYIYWKYSCWHSSLFSISCLILRFYKLYPGILKYFFKLLVKVIHFNIAGRFNLCI